MGAEDFHCPKCSQLNAANRTTCKECGADLRWAVPYNIPMKKTTRSIIIKVFAVFAIFLIIALIKYPPGNDDPRLSAARGIGGAIGGTIKFKHSDYLINGNKYTLDDVLSSTALFGGIIYNTTPNNTPAMSEICSNVAGNKICVNLNDHQFVWDWTPQIGETQALIVEDSTSAFP